MHEGLDAGDGLFDAGGVQAGAHLDVEEEELEQAVGVDDAPIAQRLLDEQVGDQCVALVAAQLVVEGFDDLFPVALGVAGAQRGLDIGGDDVDGPEAGGGVGPREQAVDGAPWRGWRR